MQLALTFVGLALGLFGAYSFIVAFIGVTRRWRIDRASKKRLSQGNPDFFFRYVEAGAVISSDEVWRISRRCRLVVTADQIESIDLGISSRSAPSLDLELDPASLGRLEYSDGLDPRWKTLHIKLHRAFSRNDEIEFEVFGSAKFSSPPMTLFAWTSPHRSDRLRLSVLFGVRSPWTISAKVWDAAHKDRARPEPLLPNHLMSAVSYEWDAPLPNLTYGIVWEYNDRMIIE